MAYRLAIDSGGTFTDVLAASDDGALRVAKVSSTPHDPAVGFVNAVRRILDVTGARPDEVEVVLHGTTVGINAILQGRFPPIGLVVTKGFRHILELGRQLVPGERGAIYTWVKPPRLVPLERVREVTERIDARGNVLTPLDEAEVRALARWFRARGVDTIAVAFLNAYASPVHEHRAAEIIREEHPNAFVATSHDTLPEFREYERTITTCMNAVLMPVLSKYVADLQSGLAGIGVDSSLFIMKSSGGCSSAEQAIAQPVYTAMSGPSAAVLGMAWVGKQAGLDDLITFDMGGTSTDVALVERGLARLSNETELDVYPIKAPSIDVISVGAGGGSIAWTAPGGSLRVGPRSAGADPGPACYQRGGIDATISDANVVLGRLGGTLAGGEVRIDRALAEAAVRRFGESLGLDVLAAARGIVEIADFNMADAIRQVSIARGRDPRRFALVAAGGAGPLHAGHLAQLLSIPTVVIPPTPGVGCATGLLVSNVKEDFVATCIQGEGSFDLGAIGEQFGRLEQRARAVLATQGFADGRVRIERSGDLRYKGMQTELTVALPDGPIDDAFAAELVEALHHAHQDAYGYAYRGRQPVELVNVRVAGIGLMPGLPTTTLATGGEDPTAAEVDRRDVYFDEAGDYVRTPIYDRGRLLAGNRIEGPAIVDQYDSTTVIFPGQWATVHPSGAIVVQVGS